MSNQIVFSFFRSFVLEITFLLNSRFGRNRKIKDFSKDNDDDRTQYRYRIILKNNNLKKKVKNAAQFIFMLFDEMKKDIIYLIAIMYEFNE